MLPLVRAEGYRLLAQSLRYPVPVELRAALAEAEAAPEPLPVLAPLATLADDALAGEYDRLFARSVAVSPYESGYCLVDKGTCLGQLAMLYEAFGARIGGEERELADHVGAELEFAALLALKEHLAATDEELEVTRSAQRVFMEDHLGRWADAFARKLAGVTDHPFYAVLAGVLREWVLLDLREHGWSPRPAQEPGDGAAEESEPMVCPMHRAEA